MDAWYGLSSRTPEVKSMQVAVQNLAAGHEVLRTHWALGEPSPAQAGPGRPFPRGSVVGTIIPAPEHRRAGRVAGDH